MSFSVTSGIPATFTIGDAVSIQLTDSDHPAGDWTSTLYFKDESGAVLPFARTSIVGSDHVFALTNANTLTLVAGRNSVCVVFSDGTHQQTSDWREVVVLDNPTAASTPTFAESQVTTIQTALASLSSGTHSAVSFNGQSFTRRNEKDLRDQLTYWQARVNFEREQAKVNRGLKPTSRRIPFTPSCR